MIALGTHRFRYLEVGLEGQAVGLVSTMVSAGGLAGLHWGDALSIRLLGSAGLRHYDGIGRGLLSAHSGRSSLAASSWI